MPKGIFSTWMLDCFLPFLLRLNLQFGCTSSSGCAGTFLAAFALLLFRSLSSLLFGSLSCWLCYFGFSFCLRSLEEWLNPLEHCHHVHPLFPKRLFLILKMNNAPATAITTASADALITPKTPTPLPNIFSCLFRQVNYSPFPKVVNRKEVSVKRNLFRENAHLILDSHM